MFDALHIGVMCFCSEGTFVVSFQDKNKIPLASMILPQHITILLYSKLFELVRSNFQYSWMS